MKLFFPDNELWEVEKEGCIFPVAYAIKLDNVSDMI